MNLRPEISEHDERGNEKKGNIGEKNANKRERGTKGNEDGKDDHGQEGRGYNRLSN